MDGAFRRTVSIIVTVTCLLKMRMRFGSFDAAGINRELPGNPITDLRVPKVTYEVAPT